MHEDLLFCFFVCCSVSAAAWQNSSFTGAAQFRFLMRLSEVNNNDTEQISEIKKKKKTQIEEVE